MPIYRVIASGNNFKDLELVLRTLLEMSRRPSTLYRIFFSNPPSSTVDEFTWTS